LVFAVITYYNIISQNWLVVTEGSRSPTYEGARTYSADYLKLRVRWKVIIVHWVHM